MLKLFKNAALDTRPKLRPTARDQILIEALVLKASIGIFPREYKRKQKIQIDLILDVEKLDEGSLYARDNILRYDHVVNDISDLLSNNHFELVETLAEKITETCFEYASVEHVNITVTKLDAVKAARRVGVRLQREKIEF